MIAAVFEAPFHQ